MSQILQNFAIFQQFQLHNLEDFEKCCKTHILNYYFLAKIGADTAENEQQFAGILPIVGPRWPSTATFVTREVPPRNSGATKASRQSESSSSFSRPIAASWCWTSAEFGGSAKLANFAKFCKICKNFANF